MIEMLLERPLPFIENYLECINQELMKKNPNYVLSKKQKLWLSFCLSGVLLTNSICWKRFERISLGKFRFSALSWMFRNSKISFDHLLQQSTCNILKHYGIKDGALCLDDVDRARSKSTKKIYKVHKLKDKLTGGFLDGQCIVFLFLVTPVASFPVGFEFYHPDPLWKAWKKKDDRLKKKKIPKKKRPKEPQRNPEYPTKVQLALELLNIFHKKHPDIEIKAILADGLYGHAEFVDGSSLIFGGTQTITKMKYNQNVRFKNRIISVQKFFESYPLIPQKVSVRGKEDIEIFISSARLYVPSHNAKRFVIAMQYPDEKKPRYLLASDLSWRTLDIVQAYFFRWLIEVFFEDWKGHEGWGKLTKHTGEDGSRSSLILSLLLDHALFFHHHQKARLENKLPAWSVGSLSQRIHTEALVQFVQDFCGNEINEQKLDKLKERIDNIIPFNPSTKHMSSRTFPQMKPSPSLERFQKKVA
jgi:hypothetical protein